MVIAGVRGLKVKGWSFILILCNFLFAKHCVLYSSLSLSSGLYTSYSNRWAVG